ncbi:MAG: hypothetical protein H6729_13880 [Deltaproteobacteria bacterium]|nr:hypothetical protein [Deltaproteobacteria bacterium]
MLLSKNLRPQNDEDFVSAMTRSNASLFSIEGQEAQGERRHTDEPGHLATGVAQHPPEGIPADLEICRVRRHRSTKEWSKQQN